MDAFGIGAALRGAANIYFHGARQTGRTTLLLESLKDGDRVVCPTQKEVDWLSRRAKEYGLKVDFIVIDPRKPEDCFKHPTSKGRTVFEHTWVEQFYQEALDKAARDIDNLQTGSSGWGTPHIKTKMQAEQMRRWGLY